jgi:MFS family permease
MDGSADAALWIGWTNSAACFVKFFFAPIMGQLTDSFGRKPLLVVGAWLDAVPCVLCAAYMYTGGGPSALPLTWCVYGSSSTGSQPPPTTHRNRNRNRNRNRSRSLDRGRTPCRYFYGNILAGVVPTSPLYFAWVADVFPEPELRIKVT